MSLYFFETGTPFARIEHPRLLEAIQSLRPDAKLQSRKTLAEKNLDEAYSSMKTKMNDICAGIEGTLISDGWSNVNNQSVINYILATPSKTIFLETEYTGATSHNAENLSNDMIKVIDKYPTTNFAGICTDNTAANKSMWKILESKYPSKFCYGCQAHGLHLLVKDFFYAEKRDGLYPPTYPLGKLCDTLTNCMSISKFFKKHPLEYAPLQERFKLEGYRSLKLAGATRWGTIQSCIVECLQGEKVLLDHVNQRDWCNKGPAKQKKLKEKIFQIIHATDFISSMQLSLKVLSPIDHQIRKFQGNNVPISDVYACWAMFEDIFSHMEGLSFEQKSYMKGKVAERWNFIYGDAYGVAYLLDPRYCNLPMEAHLRTALTEFIITYKIDGIEEVSNALAILRLNELGEFQNATLNPPPRLLTGDLTPLMFWSTYGSSYPSLRPIAKRIFSLVPTAASAERNWSSHGFIHSKDRNRLASTKVDKLVYLFVNSKMDQSTSSDSTIQEYLAMDPTNAEIEEAIINLADEESSDNHSTDTDEETG
jgi:hypothetical protein